jgi:hypothetical protein
MDLHTYDTVRHNTTRHDKFQKFIIFNKWFFYQ